MIWHKIGLITSETFEKANYHGQISKVINTIHGGPYGDTRTLNLKMCLSVSGDYTRTQLSLSCQLYQENNHLHEPPCTNMLGARARFTFEMDSSERCDHLQEAPSVASKIFENCHLLIEKKTLPHLREVGVCFSMLTLAHCFYSSLTKGQSGFKLGSAQTASRTSRLITATAARSSRSDSSET